jgi:hypothetical protein
MASDKKNRANRENSQKSTGPTSPEGKARARINASKWGLFSKELVVPAAGEKQEDFDALICGIRDQFPPQDFVSAVLVEDLATTIWRLQRPLRCETAEIRKQYATVRFRRLFKKMAEVDVLKARFIRDCAAQSTAAPRSADRLAFSLSLEDTRRQLEQTSLGLEFLLDQIEHMKKALERYGYLSSDTEEVLIAVCGVGADATWCSLVVSQLKAKMERSDKTNAEGDRTAFEKGKEALSALLKLKTKLMEATKEEIKRLESLEEEAYVASLVMLPAEVSEKIYRVETAHRRNLFKTLDLLLAVFYGKDR